MKILIATGLYPPESGGPATYSALLEKELPKRGIEVEVLPFREVRSLLPGVRHVVYFIKCITRSRGCNIIYALDPVSVGFPASWAAKITRKKFLLRVAGDYAWEQGRQRFGVTDELDEFQNKIYDSRVERFRRMQKKVADRALKIVVPSDYMKRIVGGWIASSGVEGVDAKVQRIYSSITLPPKFELPVDRPQGFLVLSMGRPVPWKNFEGLKRAVESEKEWTLKILNDLPHAQAMGWIKTADVFVLNSTYEGLSHLLVEAMSLGTPVVATAIGGNPELITDQVDGLLVPPKNDQALHDAIMRVHDDAAAARERAQKALEKTKQFDIQVALDSLVTLLRTL